MSLIDFFLSRKKNTADIAKKRLKKIISENKKNIIYCKYFIDLKQELFFIIDKYLKMNPNSITVNINQKIPNTVIIQLNRKSSKQ